MLQPTRLNRIEKILDYIHHNLEQPITVSDLAEKSCWSRWQFQRVFSDATGLSVAQYIRELRLSNAAERLINTKERHLDIAIDCGFDSEISFSRSFKKLFGHSPRDYRLIGKRQGIKTPIKYTTPDVTSYWTKPHAYPQVRIESKDDFVLYGLGELIDGPFSIQPNFKESVPKIWQTLLQTLPSHLLAQLRQHTTLGVIDTNYHKANQNRLKYWAGLPVFSNTDSLGADIANDIEEAVLNSHQNSSIHIPKQEYAVITVKGEVSLLEQAVKWFILHWLPESNYHGVAGYELELYPPNYNPLDPNGYMEYWLPIEPLLP